MSKPSADLKRVMARIKRDCGLLVQKLGEEAEVTLKDIKETGAEIIDHGIDEFSTMMNTTAKEVAAFNKKRKSAKKPGTPSAPDSQSK
jgi:hypothetical protein